MAETNEASGELAPALTPAVVVREVPQFSRAEYAHLPHTETCALCAQQLGESYYRSGDKKLCGACAERLFAAFPRDSHARFMRGLLFGAAAAILGLAVYATFTIVTHIYLGYLALGVGWLIARAILKGSGEVGGRRYQVAAVLLTYAAIALAEVPIALYHLLQNPKIHASAPAIVLYLWPRLLWYGVASPFLQLRQGVQGIIGLFILVIGLRIAWRFTQARGTSLEGPYPIT